MLERKEENRKKSGIKDARTPKEYYFLKLNPPELVRGALFSSPSRRRHTIALICQSPTARWVSFFAQELRLSN